MQDKLTKAAIVENLHDKLGYNRDEIHTIVDEFFEEVKDALRDGRVIELRGFGTFEIKVRKGREKARNPKTGESVSVARHGVALFRAGRELKNDIWELDKE